MIDLSQVVYALGRVTPSGLMLLGTAFAVASDKVATALHVVGADDQNLALVMPKIKHQSDYQDTSDTSIGMASMKIIEADPIHDICILQSDDIVVRHSTLLASTDHAPVGAQVFTLGFPHANHGRMVLTQQNTQVGARVLIDSAGQKVKHIILNTQAREGQSGGPVLLDGSMQIVAMLIGSYAPQGAAGGISLGGIDPQTLHQTTHAISAEYVKAML